MCDETDLQRIQCRIVDPAGDGQLVDGLEPANCFPSFWADNAIDFDRNSKPSCTSSFCATTMVCSAGGHFRRQGLCIGIVAVIVVLIAVVRIIIIGISVPAPVATPVPV